MKKSIRIAKRYQIEDDFLIETGGLEDEYTPTDLNRAFEFLLECGA